MPYITGLAGGATGYFVDNTGTPRLWVGAETWGLPTNAGRWNGTGGGTWQQDFDSFFAARAAQGVTVLKTDPFGNITDGGLTDNGNTWDGLAPFTTGTDPASGLSDPFWQRIDYMLNSALAAGVTVGIVINSYDFPTGCVYNGWTTTQWQAFGTALGTRYAAQPNLIWLFGNDDTPVTHDSVWNFFLTGLSGAGDTHMTVAWWSLEYTSRYETHTNTAAAWGAAHSAIEFCYTFNAGYWIIEYAYGEVANQGAPALLPVIWGDGYFYQGGVPYSATLDRAMRQEYWWCLASGARGVLSEAENIWQWPATAPAAVTTNWFFVNNLPHIVSAFTGLSGWHLLIPDTANQLVTGGRGTRVTGFVAGGSGGSYEPAFTNSYVAASKVPDGSLAVLYFPNTATVTIDQSKLPAGYGAKWMDPVTGATQTAVKGSSYNSAAPGSNSQGDPDWVLILSTPPYATWTVP